MAAALVGILAIRLILRDLLLILWVSARYSDWVSDVSCSRLWLLLLHDKGSLTSGRFPMINKAISEVSRSALHLRLLNLLLLLLMVILAWAFPRLGHLRHIANAASYLMLFNGRGLHPLLLSLLFLQELFDPLLKPLVHIMKLRIL